MAKAVVNRRVVVRNGRRVSWWQALGGRWALPRAPREVDDMGGMGTDLALDARLQADPRSRVLPENSHVGGDSVYPVADRLNGRSVI
jgi:hypothetical protein